MYQVIKIGMEFELFTEQTNNSLFATIQKEIIILLKQLIEKKEQIKPVFIGAFALHDIPLKKGGKTNIWVEYNAKILPLGLIDVGIHNAIIYDEIPDVVLDKYNDLKTLIFNSSA